MSISTVTLKTMFKHPRASIKPLEIDRLFGRILEFSPAKKSDDHRTIILVYGQHASLERVFGIAEYLSQFGRVLVPDLPGFGGMAPWRRKGQKPNFENYAKYLGSFIDQKVGSKKPIQIVGMSFGFWAVTRLFQLRPDLAKRCRLVASLVGFVDGRSMKFGFWQRHFYLKTTWLIQNPTLAWVFNRICLPPPLLRFVYSRTSLWKDKLSGVSPADKKALVDFEVNLWQINDTATWASTARQMMTKNLKGQPPVETALLHIATDNDQYIDPQKNRADLEQVYGRVDIVTVKTPAHAPPVIANARQVAKLLPADFGQWLRQSLK